jgi:hypothetical protein
MRASVFCFVLLMTGASDSMSGQDRPSPTTLKGLKGVFLQVYADRGLQQAMETRTEQTLRQAGIKVLSEKDWELVPDTALLHLDVIIRCERDEVSCGYSVGLKLGQHVQLTRGQRDIITATTWHSSYTASISKAQLTTLPDLLAVDARTLVLNFIGDYRTANPQ